MKSHLISCIVPVFNGERYLAETLDSILGQTYRPVQIIVVDDGSTDETARVVADYGPSVTYLFQPNAGPAAAKNLGVSAAQGQFLAFLDADDLWHPEKLARQMARFQARPELDACLTHVQNFWIPELRDEANRFQDDRRARPLPGYYAGALLAKQGLFDTVGRFDPALGHGDDTDWFLRAAERGAVSELLPDVLVYRRLHQTNRSRALASDSRNEYVRIVKAALDRRRAEERNTAAPSGFPTASVDETG
jgi:glycosyltransferase involved in cell wall biosynthesis